MSKYHPLAPAIALVVKLLSRTLRYEIRDEAGALDPEPAQAIWVFWHNRLAPLPWIFATRCHRKGAVLASASGDGALIADVLTRFRLESARGSTSRRAAAGFIGLVRLARNGYSLAITPDGPRGPRYRMSQGPVALASKTGLPITLVHVRIASYVALRSWDRFMIPKPFSRISVHFEPLVHVPPDADDASLERFRADLEQRLNRRRDDPF